MAAIVLHERMRADFRDEQSGGFFLTADNSEELLFRAKEIYDGAIPSGNNVAVWNALRLGRMTGEAAYEEETETALRAFAHQVDRSPLGSTQLLVALDFALGPTREIAITGPQEAEDTRALVQAVRELYLPRAVLLLRPTDQTDPPVTKLAPFTQDQTAQQGRAAAYVCRDQACEEPVTDPDVLRRRLQAR